MDSFKTPVEDMTETQLITARLECLAAGVSILADLLFSTINAPCDSEQDFLHTKEGYNEVVREMRRRVNGG